MLYVTTRNNRDAYTAQRVLRENRGPDGGLYVPFREPVFSREEIDALKEKSFHQCVAEVLNRLFNTKLTRWDVEFCVGRYPVRLVNLPQRIIAGECWHNPEWTFDHLVHILAEQLRGGCPGADGGWVKTAVGIAVLFGIFGEFARAGITEHEKRVDISVVCGNFDLPMSAWYARAWGLPIGNIICCCNENGNLWNLIHHGQFRTDTVSTPTGTPEADVTLPGGLERLIYACGGLAEVDGYLDACRRGGMYCPKDSTFSRLREGLDVSVVSSRRMISAIAGIRGSAGYLLSPYAALAYAGLLDFRGRTGESCHALVLAEKSPICDAGTVAGALGVSEDALEQYME